MAAENKNVPIFAITEYNDVKWIDLIRKGTQEQGSFTNRSIIVWTPKKKSLLASLCEREEIPLFGKEGAGEIYDEHVFIIMDSLVTMGSGGMRNDQT